MPKKISVFILLLSSIVLCAQEVTTDGEYTKTWYEVPVLRLNFYMMGMDSVDQDITIRIGDNVTYLNQEFEGKVKFILNELVMDSNHAYLPDLHLDYFKRRGQHLHSLIDPIEREGSINVYIFNTYSADNKNSALMGFTPILRMKQKSYHSNMPRFDRIFIAYPGLQDMSTLVHEMGHFLGLRHPWEMNHIDQELMGLTKDSISQKNHMTYQLDVSEFTSEQLERMRDFALRFRGYLVENIQTEFN